MTEKNLPAGFIRMVKKVKAKRPRTVIEHILKHGYITTEQLKVQYGYNHPPRAIRDVKENGIPIEMFRVEGSDGRKIAAYKFGDPAKTRYKKFAGRTILSNELKGKLVKLQGPRCAIYLEPFEERELQIDHRIPFEISGDEPSAKLDPKDYMLLCASANRAKSWSCEHCLNWIEFKNPKICKRCYWAFPDNYDHVAMLPLRRVDIAWSGKEIEDFEKLKRKAEKLKKRIPVYVKEILRKHI